VYVSGAGRVFVEFQYSFQVDCKLDGCFEGSKKVEQSADRCEINNLLDK
jgi:hypothetical protein